MERLVKEIEKIYAIYLEKFRNLDYLEHKVDMYNEMEKEKTEQARSRLLKMQQQIREDEDKMINCDGDNVRDDFSQPMNKMKKIIHMQGGLEGGDYIDSENPYD